MEKHYIGATELLEDSFKLAWKVFESGYRPNYIVGVWRGGAPIGIAVQELFDVLGVESDHIAIRTSYYSSMGERNNSVQVYGLSYLIKKLESEDSLLIVDDVFVKFHYLMYKVFKKQELSLDETRNIFFDYFLTPIATFQSKLDVSLWASKTNSKIVDYSRTSGNCHVFIIQKGE